MVTLLALGAALFYGVADFLGGAASRRASALSVLLVSIPIGLSVLAVAALVEGTGPGASGLAWGVGSGLVSGAGFLTFYRALAKGPMSVVAPVSALAGAVVPVVAGLARGESLDGRVLAGVLLCMAAIGLVSMEPGRARADTGRHVLDNGPVLAAFSGTMFGCFFVLVSQAGDGGGLWPLVASRVGVLVVILGAVLVLAARGVQKIGFGALRNRVTIWIVIGAGALDVVANIAYFKASNAGLLSVVAVLTSLYPAITVLLARIVYAERLQAVQRIGMLIALTGVALVTTG
ncbi:DMT family transporter [Actinocorallia longicatena]|uniref:DMT family transporter n=1 Tax=Actinocorallia longicatena TaxID=111803 RepID=A0ABP6Q2D5_9ACTN